MDTNKPKPCCRAHRCNYFVHGHFVRLINTCCVGWAPRGEMWLARGVLTLRPHLIIISQFGYQLYFAIDKLNENERRGHNQYLNGGSQQLLSSKPAVISRCVCRALGLIKHFTHYYFLHLQIR